MGNNGQEMMRVQEAVRNILAPISEYIDRFDVCSDPDGFHIVVGLHVPKNSTVDDIMRMPELGTGMQLALEKVRESASAMAQFDDEEEVVRTAVELQVEDVITPRFAPAASSNGVGEKPKEGRRVVRTFTQINTTPLTKQQIKDQIGSDDE